MSNNNEVIPLEEEPGSEIPSTSSNRNGGCLWRTLHFCNTFAVAILSVVVTVLFVQVQFLTGAFKQNQKQMEDLLNRVQSQQQGQIEELSQQVENEHSLTLYQMAGTFTLLTCLLTMFHITMHIRNYHEPTVQRKIIAILWMSPIYCLTSFFSLLFPSADGYLSVIKDFYEAYVIYNFLSFLIAVLGRGDRDVAVQVLARHVDHLDAPARCLRRFYHPPPETSDQAKASAVLTECQIMALQFVFIRPITSIASFVSTALVHGIDDTDHGDDNDDSGVAFFLTPGFYIAMVQNVSVFLAFRGLLRFYHAVREDLEWLQPFSKFMAIKGIVFLTFWQGLMISIIVHLQYDKDDDNDTSEGSSSSSSSSSSNSKSAQEQAAEIQNVLICLEMLFFAICHWCVFPAEEWEAGYRPKNYAKPGIGLQDFVSDMSYIVSTRRRRNMAMQSSSDIGDPLGSEDASDDMSSSNRSDEENPPPAPSRSLSPGSVTKVHMTWRILKLETY